MDSGKKKTCLVNIPAKGSNIFSTKQTDKKKRPKNEPKWFKTAPNAHPKMAKNVKRTTTEKPTQKQYRPSQKCTNASIYFQADQFAAHKYAHVEMWILVGLLRGKCFNFCVTCQIFHCFIFGPGKKASPFAPAPPSTARAYLQYR